jgi:hypothetical protein
VATGNGDGQARAATRKTAIPPSLSMVRPFWTQAPSLTPNWFTTVRTKIAPTPASCPPFSVHRQGPTGAEMRTWAVERNGKKLPRYSPKPTARAAMPPLMITKKLAQP